MANEEITRKHNLVDNEQYKNLREEYLSFIVDKANSQINSDILRGMLLLINESDRWEKEYLTACKRIKKENKE